MPARLGLYAVVSRCRGDRRWPGWAGGQLLSAPHLVVMDGARWRGRARRGLAGIPWAFLPEEIQSPTTSASSGTCELLPVTAVTFDFDCPGRRSAHERKHPLMS